ncbi:MAG: hypothetical protein NTV46_08900 [Verrucomicrobia bacterium]|nr:hypothetical protein [Verrucomicrobiota bacterium]
MVIILAAAIGIAAYQITRTHQQSEHKEVLLDAMPELAWLRGELKLTDAQFAKASALHAAYRPKCAAMCRSIAQAQARLETLARGGRGMSPELAEAIREHARVQAECQQKMLEHLYQTADLLDDRQAAKYLETVLPHALDSSGGGTVSCHRD